MRRARIKVPSTEAEADYHCTSRTVNGERIFDDVAKEVLRRQIRQVADFCGLRVLTETVMSSHFHVVVRVPRQRAVTDSELLRRYRVLHPKPTSYQLARLRVIEAQLAKGGPDAVRWRKQQLRQMGDVSQYMKLLKQRFSIWYNKTHGRFGTLWAERFKSSLLGPGALEMVCAYVDLNCVRAGIVTDPKDYRFCGYAEAVAGNTDAREGLGLMLGGNDWNENQAAYRQVLFGTGASPREGAASIPAAEVERVLAAGGKLPLAVILRCRIRYFIDGAVIGSSAFVEAHIKAHPRNAGQPGHSAPHRLPACTDWGELATLRKLRRRAIG